MPNLMTTPLDNQRKIVFLKDFISRDRYLKSALETQRFAADIASQVPAGTVFALVGDLGTGKTTFAQGFADGLGVTEHVGSPTFKLVSEYQGNELMLYHVDCYRINHPQDFLNIGGENYLYPEDGVTLIEWADRIDTILPAEVITLEFFRVPGKPNERKIVFPGETV